MRVTKINKIPQKFIEIYLKRKRCVEELEFINWELRQVNMEFGLENFLVEVGAQGEPIAILDLFELDALERDGIHKTIQRISAKELDKKIKKELNI